MGFSTCIGLALLASVLGSVCPWTLQSTHQNIIPDLTKDVTLNCFHDAQHRFPIVLESITRIRLLKLDNVSGSWVALAEVIQPDTTTVRVFNQNETGILLDGHLGNLSTTFLKTTWPRSTPTTVGSYKCEIDGFTKGNRTDSVLESSMVEITSDPVTVADLLKVIIKQEDVMKSLRKDIQSNIEDNYFESRYWPSGNYILLAPESGCPDTTSSSLVAGSATFQTESPKAPNHTFSDPNHLGGVIVTERCGSRNVVTFNACTSQRSEPRLLWPKGSYCIHSPDNPVSPPGFQYGYTVMYPETTVKLIMTSKNVLDAIGGGGTGTFIHSFFFNFICRSDGDADEPIRLPTLKPFYLYRYKGKCQSVFNMDVREEWFQIDTDEAKTDKHVNTYHPDGKLNDARFELCYYSKKTHQ